jgi:hypothetical protein
VGFEPIIPEIERPQAYAKGRAATGFRENTADVFIFILMCAYSPDGDGGGGFIVSATSIKIKNETK